MLQKLERYFWPIRCENCLCARDYPMLFQAFGFFLLYVERLALWVFSTLARIVIRKVLSSTIASPAKVTVSSDGVGIISLRKKKKKKERPCVTTDLKLSLRKKKHCFNWISFFTFLDGIRAYFFPAGPVCSKTD